MEKVVHNKNKGILLIVTSAFFFALMGIFVKLSGDLPAVEKAFFRNLIAAIAICNNYLLDDSSQGSS